MWNFAWPVAVALIHPSLLPVTVVSFFSKVIDYLDFCLFERNAVLSKIVFLSPVYYICWRPIHRKFN